MKKLSTYTSPVLVQFQKDLSVYTTSNTTQNGGYSDFNGGGNPNISGGQIIGPRPGSGSGSNSTSTPSATSKSTSIQDYNPFGE